MRGKNIKNIICIKNGMLRIRLSRWTQWKIGLCFGLHKAISLSFRIQIHLIFIEIYIAIPNEWSKYF